MSSNGLLEDKLALVTGAAGGIGRQICQVFAREGAKIAGADLKLDGVTETLQLCGDGHAGFTVDVTKSDQIAEMFTNIVETFGRAPAVVINCAGIANNHPFLEITEELFDQMMSVNVKGVFLVTQQAAKLMISHQIKGTFVNIASIAARMHFKGMTHYCASKAAVCSLTRSTATELAPHGIRCNVMLPGAIQTPMVAHVGSAEEVAELLETRCPIKRIGEPSEVAELCLFLASEKSSYMTGASVDVNGGFCM